MIDEVEDCYLELLDYYLLSDFCLDNIVLTSYSYLKEFPKFISDFIDPDLANFTDFKDSFTPDTYDLLNLNEDFED